MMAAIELLAELVDGFAVQGVGWADFEGPLRNALQVWQREGFLAREPVPHPCPICLYCEDGIPEEVAGICRCKRCFSQLGDHALEWWPFDRKEFFLWLARRWSLRGPVRQVDAKLWQLGTAQLSQSPYELFFRCSGHLSSTAEKRLSAYHSAVILTPGSIPEAEVPSGHIVRSLLQAFVVDAHDWNVVDLKTWIAPEKSIRYERQTGTLWVADQPFGSVPANERESHLLEILADQSPRFVSYAEIKQYVVRRSGSHDSRDESTFCHRLKNRLKQYVPEIDRVIDTTRTGNGYRLRSKL